MMMTTIKKILKSTKGVFVVMLAFLLPVIVTIWGWLISLSWGLNLKVYHQTIADAAAVSAVVYGYKSNCPSSIPSDISCNLCWFTGQCTNYYKQQRCYYDCHITRNCNSSWWNINNSCEWGCWNDCGDCVTSGGSSSTPTPQQMIDRATMIVNATSALNNKTAPAINITLSNSNKTVAVKLTTNNNDFFLVDNVNIQETGTAEYDGTSKHYLKPLT